MRRVIIHIGLGKTGTSSIQAWLSLNADRLLKQDIYYADLNPAAKQGNITSGNGVPLVEACQTGQVKKIKSCFRKYYCERWRLFRARKTALVSSESFQDLNLEQIALLEATLTSLGYEVSVIAYVRSAYEFLYSSYLQGIKRHGFTHLFSQNPGGDYSRQKNILFHYRDIFGERFQVGHYDGIKSDILPDFARRAGIEPLGLIPLDQKVNRSLTYEEAQCLLKMNRLHKGAFSTELSDYLIARDPVKPTRPYYTEALVKKVTRRVRENVGHINAEFFSHSQQTIQEVLDWKSNLTSMPENLPPESIDFSPVVEWCLSRPRIDEEKQELFVDFVRDFALFIEPVDLPKACSLMSLALELRPNGPLIRRKVIEYQQALAVRMAG